MKTNKQTSNVYITHQLKWQTHTHPFRMSKNIACRFFIEADWVVEFGYCCCCRRCYFSEHSLAAAGCAAILLRRNWTFSQRHHPPNEQSRMSINFSGKKGISCFTRRLRHKHYIYESNWYAMNFWQIIVWCRWIRGVMTWSLAASVY